MRVDVRFIGISIFKFLPTFWYGFFLADDRYAVVSTAGTSHVITGYPSTSYHRVLESSRSPDVCAIVFFRFWRSRQTLPPTTIVRIICCFARTRPQRYPSVVRCTRPSDLTPGRNERTSNRSRCTPGAVVLSTYPGTMANAVRKICTKIGHGHQYRLNTTKTLSAYGSHLACDAVRPSRPQQLPAALKVMFGRNVAALQCRFGFRRPLGRLRRASCARVSSCTA